MAIADLPLETSSDRSLPFIRDVFIAALVGLLLGGFLDSTIASFQPQDGTWLTAALFFFLQLTLNVFLLLAAIKYLPWFPAWIQLTLRGMVFGVVFYAVQANMIQNALRLVSFSKV